MDDFGVLVQNYGIKGQGKSPPMAASKTATRTHNYNAANLDPVFGTKPFSKSTNNLNSGSRSMLDDQNDLFGFDSGQNPGNYDVFDDVFQMPIKKPTVSNGGGSMGLDFDMESMFKGSMSLNSNSNSADVNDAVIWGFSGNGSSTVVVDSNDLLSSDPIDDFLGNLGKMGSGLRGSRSLNENKVDHDDLIPGFGRSNSENDRAQASSTGKSSKLSSFEDLEVFAMGSSKNNSNGHLNASTVKDKPKKIFNPLETNFIDIDGSIGSDSVYQKTVESASEKMSQAEAPDLYSFFNAHSQKSVPVSVDTTMNWNTEEQPDLFSGTTFKTEIKTSPGYFPDDFSSIFGDAPTSGKFEEIDGESEERRTARLRRYQKTEARMAQALADMNQREFQAQREQEERHRIAEAMDLEMKRWAAGKEGNLRALLSSLQQVLGPEFGWRAVTLTDLITSSQVKIAYNKARLCVHPDKVQQKGASLQHKYVAEKTFDLLKEAWNKFNLEELR